MRQYGRRQNANKALVLTMPARCSFGIIARHKGLGGGFGFVLPVRALAWPHNAGVSKLSYIKRMHGNNKSEGILMRLFHVFSGM